MVVLTGYHLDSSALHGEQKTLTFHRYVEALKFASGIKKHIRDPKFSSVDVSQTPYFCFLLFSFLSAFPSEL